MPTIKGYNLWQVSGDPTRQKAAVDFIVKGMADGALKPVIDRVFLFEEMRDARSARVNGK